MSSSQVFERFIPAPAALNRGTEGFGPFRARYDAYRPRLRFLTSNVGGCCESFAVDSGLVMLVMNIDLAKTTEVQLHGQDIVEFHYRLSGSLEMSGTWGRLQMREPTMLLWRQPLGCDDVSEVISAGRPREISVSLYCDPQWLANQVGAECPGALLQFLRGAGIGSVSAPVYRLCALSGRLLEVLNDVVTSPFQGPLRYLYAKGRALELLCRTVSALAAQDAPARALLRKRDRRIVLLAYEILRAECSAAPSLKTLARRIGVNTNKLCAGFKQEFGCTVSDCVRKLRLARARTLLESSDLPIGQIALEVGYKHHSTFTAAFTEHFGVAPKYLARGRGARSTP